MNTELSGRAATTIEFCARPSGTTINVMEEAFTLKCPRPRGDSAKPPVRRGLNFHGADGTTRSQNLYLYSYRRHVVDPSVSRFSHEFRGHGFRLAIALLG